MQSPSAVNTQPWEFTVVAGDVLDQIRRGNVKKLLSGSAPGKHVPGDGYRGVYKKRQVELAAGIFKLMKISRGDREKREEWLQRGFRFFDAPAAIIIANRLKSRREPLESLCTWHGFAGLRPGTE